MAFLTLATITSPRPAYRRRVPPSTLMHMHSLAPVLSATSRYVYIWIIEHPSLVLPPFHPRRTGCVSRRVYVLPGGLRSRFAASLTRSAPRPAPVPRRRP